MLNNNTQRTAWLVGLVGALVLGMPAVSSGQGSVAGDQAALEALYDATNGANWSINNNWKTTEPLGRWFGVRTNSDGRVTGLELFNNQLSGTIPAEIGNLTSLSYLDLGGNQLSGTIPAEIGNLTSLSVLFLADNQLSGTIPVEVGNLTRLTGLYLNRNQLSGQIPAALGNLTSLSALDIDTTTGLCLAPGFDLSVPVRNAIRPARLLDRAVGVPGGSVVQTERPDNIANGDAKSKSGARHSPVVVSTLRCCRLVSSPRAAGTWPVNWLSWSSKAAREVRFPSSAGIRPVNWLPPSPARAPYLAGWTCDHPNSSRSSKAKAMATSWV